MGFIPHGTHAKACTWRFYGDISDFRVSKKAFHASERGAASESGDISSFGMS
jgi:hypothetical protein